MNMIENNDAVFEAHNENLKSVMNFVKGQMENQEVSFSNDIQLAVEEIFLNIANYAFMLNDGKVNVKINITKNPTMVKLTFIDNGRPFNPKEAQKPDVDLPLEKRMAGGLGIFLVEQIMDIVTYSYENGSNILTVIKYF